MPITKYLWDGDNILAETDGSDTVTTVYTNEPQQYGNLVSQRSGTTTSYFHFDAHGSTRQLTNAAGVVSDTFTYNAWGEEVARTGTTSTPFRWIGELGYYWDSERQLYYIRHRSYSGSIGLWISVDPLFYRRQFQALNRAYSSFVGNWLLRDPLGLFADMNPYAYALNTPTTSTDPMGLWPVTKTLECPHSDAGDTDCDCDPGQCKFELFLIRNGNGIFCMNHKPGQYPDGVDATGAPVFPSHCQSDINRSSQDDFIEIVLQSGVSCKFIGTTFPGNASWPPTWGLLPPACKDIIAQAPNSNVNPLIGGCYAVQVPVKSIHVKVTLQIVCGCQAYFGTFPREVYGDTETISLDQTINF